LCVVNWKRGLFMGLYCEAQDLKPSRYSIHWAELPCSGTYHLGHPKRWLFRHSENNESNFTIYIFILKRKTLLNTCEYIKKKIKWSAEWCNAKGHINSGRIEIQNAPLKLGNKNSHHNYRCGKTNDTTSSHSIRVHFNKTKTNRII